MRVSYSLGAFYFVFFVYARLWVAYLRPDLSARGLGAAHIAWVLAGGAWLDFPAVDALPLAMFAFAFGALAVAALLPTQPFHLAASVTRLPMNRAAALLLASGFCMAVAHGTLYAFFTLHLQRE